MSKNIDLYYSDVNLLNDMLNFYCLTKYTCYPFMPVKLGFAIYKAIFHMSMNLEYAQHIFYLSFIIMSYLSIL